MTNPLYLSVFEFWNSLFKKKEFDELYLLPSLNLIFAGNKTQVQTRGHSTTMCPWAWTKTDNHRRFTYVSISLNITCNQIIHFQVTENVMKYHCIWSLRFLFFLKYHQNEKKIFCNVCKVICFVFYQKQCDIL